MQLYSRYLIVIVNVVITMQTPLPREHKAASSYLSEEILTCDQYNLAGGRTYYW